MEREHEVVQRLEKLDMKWPSERVKPGGIFHLPKVKYSQETHDLIKCKHYLKISSTIYYN